MADDEQRAWLKAGSTSSADVEHYYDDLAQSYDQTLTDWDYRAPADAANLLKAHVAPDASLLDAGCGTGLTGAALREAGFVGTIDGIDLSQPSLDLAATREIYTSLKRVDMQHLPLELGSARYDALLCIGVMTYIPDGEGILREFARVVRPGGHVLISQREDAWRDRDFDGLLSKLASEGLLSAVEVTAPKPYIPANPDFADKIGVIYAILEVQPG